MGKANRKMNKNKQKAQKKDFQQKIDKLKAKMLQYEKEMNYAEAINTLAELIDAGCREAEVIYHGARNYFMVGDYVRAAKWADMTLDFVPEHIGARILLARLCLINDRIDDGLAIFEFVLEHHEESLRADQQEELEEALSFYGKHQEQRLQESYPHILAFLRKRQLQEERSVPAQEKTEPAAAGTTESPLAALKALKNRLAAVQNDENQPEPSASPECEPVERTVEPVESVKVEEQEVSSQNAENIEREILAKEISLLEKVTMLNKFAGAEFVKGEFLAAESLLKSALRLDACHEDSLRNLAVLYFAKGEKEKAWQAAANMKRTDFVLLDLLRR